MIQKQSNLKGNSWNDIFLEKTRIFWKKLGFSCQELNFNGRCLDFSGKF